MDYKRRKMRMGDILVSQSVITPEQLDELVSFASVDVSFISLSKVIPVMRELMTENAEAVCLIKPQFEAGREKVGKKRNEGEEMEKEGKE